MNKKVIASFALLALLASCSPKAGVSVLDKGIADANVMEIEPLDYHHANLGEAVSVAEWLADGWSLNDTSFLSRGLLILSNASGERRIYDLVSATYVSPFGTTALASDVDYEILTNPAYGYTLAVSQDGKTKIVDGAGNLLYDDDILHSLTPSYREEKDGSFYYDISGLNLDGQNVSLHFTYDGDTHFLHENENLDLAYPGIDFSSLLDLEPYGLEGLYLKRTSGYGLWYVINDLGNIVNSYFVPSYSADTQSEVIVDGRIIKQLYYSLGDDETSYDLVSGGKKIAVDTVTIDLRSGKISSLELPYIIMGTGTPLNNAEGKAAYSMVNIAKINDQKRLAEAEQVAIDRNGEIAFVTNGINPKSFVKLDGGNYFNTTSEYLYDENLVLRADFSTLTSTYLPGWEMLLVNDGLRYSIIDGYGRKLIPFTSDAIYPSPLADGTFYLEKDDGFYTLTLQGEGVEKSVDDNRIKAYKDDSYYHVSSLGGGLYALSETDGSTMETSISIYFNGEVIGTLNGLDASVDGTLLEWLDGTGYVFLRLVGGNEISYRTVSLS